MKILNKFIFSIFILFFTFSCGKDELDPVGSVVKDVAITAPTANGNYVLSSAAANQTIFTLKWSSSNFGYNAAVNYSLELDKATGNFSAPQVTDLGNKYEYSNQVYEKAFTVIELNSILLGAGASIGTSQAFKMRIVAKPSKQQPGAHNGLQSISASVTFNATAYDTYADFTRIYVPGNYQNTSGYESNWSPDKAPKLYSPTNGTAYYEGFVWMNNATPEFKFTPGPSWTGDKGDSGNPNTFTTLASPGNNIKPTNGAGTYFFTVRWGDNAYTIAKKQVAIIGNASGGWGNPIYMDFVIDPTSPYYRMFVKDVVMVADEFLIRLNDDWSDKFGGVTSTVSTLQVSAQNKVKQGGSNMRVPAAGNYKVVLDVRNSANYNLRLIQN